MEYQPLYIYIYIYIYIHEHIYFYIFNGKNSIPWFHYKFISCIKYIKLHPTRVISPEINL